MKLKQLATRVEEERAEEFERKAKAIGTDTANALRIMVAAFNAHNGFPFPVQLTPEQVEPLQSEEEATELARHYAKRVANDETW